MKTKKQLVDEITVRAIQATLLPEKPTGETPKKRPYKVSEKGHKVKVKAEQLKPYQWQKGQSGNPKGRPVNPLSLTAMLNKKLSEHPELAQALVDALINIGIKVNLNQLSAIDKIFDRLEGKPAERKIIEGRLPIRIEFVPAPSQIEIKQEQEAIEGEFTLVERGG